MKRTFRAGLAATAFGLACFSFAAARADMAPAPHYDGTGSIYAPRANNDFDPARMAALQAKDDAHRADVARRAAEGKHPDAMVDYAGLLEQGDGAHAADLAGALDYYEKAADLGNTVGLRRMAIAYLLGEGRPLNLTKGFGYSDKLGAKDSVEMFAAGLDYEQGITGPKDQGMAVTAYIEAAKAGNADAMDAGGRIALSQGKAEIARGWFRQAVYFGSADAMDHLAAMAEAGQGGPADKALAYWLYVNAARRGNVHAQGWVAALPATAAPLPRAQLRDGHKEMTLTRSYGTPGHMHSEPVNPAALASSLQGHYPNQAFNDHVDGRATIHCYVNAGHQVDACIIQRESPMGYDFGNVLGQLYDGTLTVDDTDAAGRPTANTVFALTLAWQFR